MAEFVDLVRAANTSPISILDMIIILEIKFVFLHVSFFHGMIFSFFFSFSRISWKIAREAKGT